MLTEQNKTFDCTKCGACCRNLLTKQADVLLGLVIMPSERNFFPAEHVRPMWAYTLRGRFKTVLAWQLALNTCPYLSLDNSCAKYDERPGACRSYPLSFIFHDKIEIASIDVKCPESTPEKRVSTNAINFFSEEQLTSSLLTSSFVREMTRLHPGDLFLFDLESESWKKLSEERARLMLSDDMKKSLGL